VILSFVKVEIEGAPMGFHEVYTHTKAGGDLFVP